MGKLFPDPVSVRTAQRTLAQELFCLYPPDEAKALAWLALEHAMNAARVQLLTRSDVPLTHAQTQQLEQMAKRLLRHEPIQYITGTAWFLGLELHVAPGVLIPRPETEELAQHIINRHKKQQHLRILDIGTGSGCLAIGLGHFLPGSQVQAVDFSEDALNIARANAAKTGISVQFWHADVLQPLPENFPAGFDIIVSNPPYVLQSEEEQMLPNVLQFEPHSALFVPDTDPLLFYRAIAAIAKERLKPGGWLYFETNQQYAGTVAQLLKESGFGKARALNDLFEKPRFAEAQR